MGREILPIVLTTTMIRSVLMPNSAKAVPPRKPNIIAIWGDDVSINNISAYNHGMMGYKTPNIDRIAREGTSFNGAYAQQSCTAGQPFSSSANTLLATAC